MRLKVQRIVARVLVDDGLAMHPREPLAQLEAMAIAVADRLRRARDQCWKRARVVAPAYLRWASGCTNVRAAPPRQSAMCGLRGCPAQSTAAIGSLSQADGIRRADAVPAGSRRKIKNSPVRRLGCEFCSRTTAERGGTNIASDRARARARERERRGGGQTKGGIKPYCHQCCGVRGLSTTP